MAGSSGANADAAAIAAGIAQQQNGSGIGSSSTTQLQAKTLSTPTTQSNPLDLGLSNNSTAIPAYYPSTGTAVSSTSASTAATTAPTSDFRVRIAPLNASLFYGQTTSAAGSPLTSSIAPLSSNSSVNTGSTTTGSTTQLPSTSIGASNLLQPLIATNGVMFPYSPQITFEQSVDYTQTEMIQTNLTYEVYSKTPSVNITIAGKFTIQNQTEGKYAMAVIHFFRVASKMYFGTLSGNNAGLPPPILLLNGYGTYMFNNLNCILKTHSWSYDEAVDTISVSVAGGTARLPCVFTMSVNLTVQQTPQAMRSKFNLDAFRTGQLMTTGGWI